MLLSTERGKSIQDYLEDILSGPIDNMTGNIDYTVTPTPNHASVFLTSGNVTPISCPI